MRSAFVIVGFLAPVIAFALPNDATLSRLLVGTWRGPRYETQYRADGTWIWIRRMKATIAADNGGSPTTRSAAFRGTRSKNSRRETANLDNFSEPHQNWRS
jgi:hypothetical protein